VSRIRATALEDLLAEAWTGPAWHGPALREVVHSLAPEQAIVRLRDASHSPWALILHAAYWKHRVRCRIANERGSRFARKPSNFPAPPREPDVTRWREDLAGLDTHAEALLALAATLRDRDLDRPAGRYTVEASLRGIALHDLYHAGQIRMLQRMIERKQL